MEAFMIEMTDIGIDHAVSFRMRGKITESDMITVLSDAKEKIKRHGNIVILEIIESFQGIEIAALVEEFKYLHQVGISNVRKAAVVTDKKWLKDIVSIEGKLFKNIEMKCFSNEDMDAAIEFLKKA
jgi:hypothetical protein